MQATQAHWQPHEFTTTVQAKPQRTARMFHAHHGARAGLFSRMLTPLMFLAGVLSAFVSCCLLGEIVSKQNYYQDFMRFHGHTNHLTLFFPTISQLREIVHARLE